MLPSATDLTYFLEVVQTKNISRASERLGISQPSLSVSLQRLEHSVGTSLLHRTKKGTHLTPAGERLYLKSRELLQQWEALRTHAVQANDDLQGQYTIGCHTAIAQYSLPHFLPELLNKHPKLEVKLVHDLSRKIVEQVVSLEVDIGIVINPVRHPDLILKKLSEDEVTLWVGSGRNKTQDPKGKEAVLICDLNMIQSQDIIKKIKRSSLNFNRIITSTSLEVITELTLSGAGIGILPGRVAQPKTQFGLKKIQSAPIFKDEIYLAYRVENKNIRAIQEIVKCVEKIF